MKTTFNYLGTALLAALTLLATSPRAPAQTYFGNGLSFDGTNDYVDVPDGIWFSNNFTIEAWVYVRSSNSWSRVLDFGNGAPRDNVSLCVSEGASGRPVFALRHGDAVKSITAWDPIPTQQWVHLAAVLNGPYADLYVNGVIVAWADDWTPPNPVLRTNNYIARSPWAQDKYADMVIDELRIWSVARAPWEIRQSMVHPVPGTEPNLAGLWRFDEISGDTAADSTSNGNHGILVNGPQWTRSTIPPWGHALDFDGVDDFVDAQSIPWPLSTSFTIEAWVYVRSYNSWSRVLDFGQGAPSDNIVLALSEETSGRPVFEVFAGSTEQRITGPHPIPTNQWVHLAATLNNGLATLYVNGAAVASAAGWQVIPFTRRLNYIGRSNWEGDRYADFMLDELRLWNVARTQAEIAADMLDPLTGAEPGLASYLHFDEGFGFGAYDSAVFSGINWAAALMNGTAWVRSSLSAPNLLINPGFEEGTRGWHGFDWATFVTSGSGPKGGANSGYVTDRAHNYSGVAQSLLGVLQPDVTYYFSAWVRLASGSSQPVSLNILKTEDGVTTYPGVAGAMARAGEWTQLTGSYTLTVNGQLTALTLYISGPDPGVSFYVDDFAISQEMVTAPPTLAVTTLPATGVDGDAMLHGMVQPAGHNTTTWFEWGTSLGYGNSTAPETVGVGTDPVPLSASLTDLAPGRVYHFRAAANDPYGTVYGADQVLSLPIVFLKGADRLTNECHAPFDDPGAFTVRPAIAAGWMHSLALQADGTVAGWGNNGSGQTDVPAPLLNVAAIAAGENHSLALQANGTVVGWGLNTDGQASGLPNWGNALSFNGTNDGSYVRATIPALASNYTVSAWVFLREGGNWANNRVGVLSHTSCGGSTELLVHSLTSSYTDPQYLWLQRCGSFNGTNSTGNVPLNQWVNLAVTVSSNRQVSYFINGTPATSWIAPVNWNVAIGPVVTLANNTVRRFNGMLDDFRIWSVARSQEEIQADLGHPLTGGEPNLLAYWKFDEASGTIAHDSTTNGYNGTLVNAPVWTNAHSLVTVAGQLLTNVAAISAGWAHNLALLSNRTVVGWGATNDGRATTPNLAVDVVAVAAGSRHGLAIRADGTVVGWGFNADGQATGIPNGTPPNYSVGTVMIAGRLLNDAVKIAAGELHSLALRADGTVVGWGYNNYGQADSPPEATNVVAIAAGSRHSLGLRADGTVVGWGAGTSIGSPPHYGQAMIPAEAVNVVAIAAGGRHSLALRADGVVVGWGAGTSVGESPHYGQAMIPADLMMSAGLSASMSVSMDSNTPGTNLWTYTATNALGLAGTATRTVVVLDTRAPVLTLRGDNPLVHPYRALFTDPGATAADLCGGDLTGSILVSGNVDPNTLGTFYRTYSVTDSAGNGVSTNREVQVKIVSFTPGDSDGDGTVQQHEFDAVARNYWGPASRPYMTNVVTDGAGLFQMTLTNAAAWNFSVEVSTNLQDWEYLGPAFPLLEFHDSQAPGQPQRYYRLTWP